MASTWLGMRERIKKQKEVLRSVSEREDRDNVEDIRREERQLDVLLEKKRSIDANGAELLG